MRRFVWLIAVALWLGPAAPAQAQKKSKAPRKETPAKKEAPDTKTLTGCVDEKDGVYTLTEDTAIKTIAKLQAVGFEQEGFAKFVGHKVSVTGQLTESGDTPSMKVRAIKKIAEVCAPAQQ
ncbi:MAG: hypothetical protein ACRD8O_00230 [Bryobacteraceae bacterium]